MSSLFDIPAQLAMLLSLAAATVGQEPAAVPPTSLADTTPAVVVEPLVGPLRFGERAWLRALHENGLQTGPNGSRVFLTSGGRYYAPTPAERRRILDARNDPEYAARVARSAAEHNATRIRAAIKRQPTAGDLYVAHLFGAGTAIALLRAVSTAPADPLKSRFPELAAAAPELDRASGVPVTVRQFYLKLSAALPEPPRLVAIGLRPSVADAPEERAIDAALKDPQLAWKAQIDIAAAMRARKSQ